MKFLLLLMTILTFQNVSAQYFEVEYIYKQYPVKELRPTDNPILKETRVLRYNRFISYTLVHQGSKSLFKKSKPEKQYKTNLEVPTKEYEEDIYYKDFQSKELVGSVQLLNRYEIKDKIRLIDWRLAKEQKYILGYKCFKAKAFDCRRNEYVVAWYSPTLPITNGPFHFDGLPGLILKLEFMVKDKVGGTVTAESIDQYNEPYSNIERPKIKDGVTMEKVCENKTKFLSTLQEKYLNQKND